MILALKTAGGETEMYLTTKEGNIEHELKWESHRELADKLLTKITEFLSANGLELADLEGIAIFSGPGSFTSLRIGHSVANALADGLGIPVAGAMGEDWLPETARLVAKKPADPAMPQYGAEAHITMSKTHRGGPKS